MNENITERIDASIQTDQSRIYAARKLSKWFSVYIRIQIFGQTILELNSPETLFSEMNLTRGGDV